MMYCIPCVQVVGDIVRLNAGDRVPSDGVIVECSDLTCNESALTGESEDKVTANSPLAQHTYPFLSCAIQPFLILSNLMPHILPFSSCPCPMLLHSALLHFFSSLFVILFCLLIFAYCSPLLYSLLRFTLTDPPRHSLITQEKGTESGEDMFLLSGSNISTGYCHMLATAVGAQSR